MPGRFANIELQLLPGALTDDTDLAAKLRAIDMDKVRFRGNRAETIKAWLAFNVSGMSSGTARGIHTYTDLDGDPIVVAASESAVNAWKGGTRYIITPVWRDMWLDAGAHGGLPTHHPWIVYNPATDTGVEVPHGLAVGDVGDILQCDRCQCAQWHVHHCVGPDRYHVHGHPIAPAPPVLQQAFTCTVAFKNGLVTGTGDTFATRTRIWSIDNFGENAVMCGRTARRCSSGNRKRRRPTRSPMAPLQVSLDRLGRRLDGVQSVAPPSRSASVPTRSSRMFRICWRVARPMR